MTTTQTVPVASVRRVVIRSPRSDHAAKPSDNQMHHSTAPRATAARSQAFLQPHGGPQRDRKVHFAPVIMPSMSTDSLTVTSTSLSKRLRRGFKDLSRNPGNSSKKKKRSQLFAENRSNPNPVPTQAAPVPRGILRPRPDEVC